MSAEAKKPFTSPQQPVSVPDMCSQLGHPPAVVKDIISKLAKNHAAHTSFVHRIQLEITHDRHLEDHEPFEPKRKMKVKKMVEIDGKQTEAEVEVDEE